MRFKILKSGLDGISGGESAYSTIDDVLREVSYHKGWPSREALHTSILKWSNEARPGSVFCTQVTAIVAVAVDQLNRVDDECHHCGHEGLDYGDFDPVESGDIEQEVKCPECGERWMDIFTLTEQRDLCREG
jgi:DNA-directed RNA polymerase subunit RPC12/RpoP